MITQRELREKAREYGVPISTIERDYVQNWLLKYFSSINMVLKGGTGIRKAYIGEYRFSDDLDFTLLEEINKEQLKVLLKESVKNVKEESGINLSEDFRFQENDNGFEIDIYFQIMQRGGNRTRIKIDITKHGNEEILLPLNMRKIIHPYSDRLKANIKVYSLEEIIAEKVRSLFQRTRPRDLYDVWYLRNSVDQRKVLDIFLRKCEFKDVRIVVKDLEDRKDDFKNAWENSLGHQLKNIPDFDDVFSSVVEDVEKRYVKIIKDNSMKVGDKNEGP
ncbi:MAG: CRISPR-associated protein Csx11 [Thermoplasmata archaeon]|nr:MAG: CRISPR-associated protein Csx11 [Thermoplasmata archaeon]